MSPVARWYGDRAVSVGPLEAQDRSPLRSMLAALLPDHDVRGGMDAVLVVAGEPDVHLLEVVQSALATWVGQPDADQGGGVEVVLSVVYEGIDLSDVADVLGCSVSHLVAAHQRQRWRVAMMGFAPGFGYLAPEGPPEVEWANVGRLARPRRSVPAGSVGIAAGMSAVYPQAMPGGWRLIGSCPEPLFDPQAVDDPARLHPGDLVRFRARS